MDALIFIDTNIMLDFYRIRIGESGLSVLGHIDANHAKIITGSQVEMEFKKNRQNVILESIGKLKPPDWASLSPAAFLSDAKPVKMISKSKADLIKQQKKLKDRLGNVLTDPVQNDPVYKSMQRLFTNGGHLNLRSDKKESQKIQRLAWKRFVLGQPPRKKTDTSIGDAINWEWMIQCAIATGKDVIIVSRDADYGSTYDKKPLLNDFLDQEFKERVGKRRKVILTDKLTEAFKRAAITVTEKEEKDEQELIDEKERPDLTWPDFAERLSKIFEMGISKNMSEKIFRGTAEQGKGGDEK